MLPCCTCCTRCTLNTSSSHTLNAHLFTHTKHTIFTQRIPRTHTTDPSHTYNGSLAHIQRIPRTHAERISHFSKNCDLNPPHCMGLVVGSHHAPCFPDDLSNLLASQRIPASSLLPSGSQQPPRFPADPSILLASQWISASSLLPSGSQHPPCFPVDPVVGGGEASSAVEES